MDCFDGIHAIRFGAATALLLLLLLTTAGCPDFSHQAPRPDYSNMTDEGGADSESATETHN